jgi:hypothetical protein
VTVHPDPSRRPICTFVDATVRATGGGAYEWERVEVYDGGILASNPDEDGKARTEWIPSYRLIRVASTDVSYPPAAAGAPTSRPLSPHSAACVDDDGRLVCVCGTGDDVPV